MKTNLFFKKQEMDMSTIITFLQMLFTKYQIAAVLQGINSNPKMENKIGII